MGHNFRYSSSKIAEANCPGYVIISFESKLSEIIKNQNITVIVPKVTLSFTKQYGLIFGSAVVRFSFFSSVTYSWAIK